MTIRLSSSESAERALRLWPNGGSEGIYRETSIVNSEEEPVNLKQLRWTALHEVALYFAPATGAAKGIRRACLSRKRQAKPASLGLGLAPLVWGFNGIRREYRALERLAERRRSTKRL